MSGFKVGDKVVSTREDSPNLYIKKGSTYTVSKVRPSGNIELKEIAEPHNYGQLNFELAQEPVLTPEEVFKHLRKGTQLECSDKGRDNWCTIHSNSRVPVGQIETFQWRIKPVPEIIESFGRKYKLIEE